ncbi:MAG: acetolactate decarboxylase [Nitrospirae bacterium]|nr:acetolactate decarboxylase [Nitrospirota bacterium]
MYYILAIILAALLSSCAQPHVLYQYSSFNALLEGVYDGALTVGELKSHGDLGLGTFNALDGEMILVNSNVYQIKGDGTVYAVDDSVETPFAAAVFFNPKKSFTVEDGISCEQLQKKILQIVPSKNIFYAIKIEGDFKHIRARAVRAQRKPYPRLIDAAKDQGEFDFNNISGTIAGFYVPENFGGLSVSGVHIHFISDDRKSGGHLLSCTVSRARVEVDYLTDFFLELPKSGDLYGKDIGLINKHEADIIEKGR